MRTVTFGCMALMLTIFGGVWSLTHTTDQTFATPAGQPAAMSPLDMTKNAGAMPVHVIVDPI